MAQYKITDALRPRWHNKSYNLYKDLSIEGDIKCRRLGWEGHITRTEDERITKYKTQEHDGRTSSGGTYYRS
jgi:hypothetical protein